MIDNCKGKDISNRWLVNFYIIVYFILWRNLLIDKVKRELKV